MKLFFECSKSNLVQCTATLAVFLLCSQAGLYQGWMSPNVARLSSEESPIPPDPSSLSWMISLGSVGSALGALLGAVSIEFLGSRKTLLVTNLFLGMNWVCVLCANSFAWLHAARLIGGIAVTMFNCCFSLYLSEITSPKIRGTLISLSLTGSILGVILGLIAETYLKAIYSCSIYLTLVALGLLLLLFLKDTPYYSVKQNDTEGAKRSLMFYRGNVDVEEELQDIQKFVKNSSESAKDKFRQLRRPVIRKSMLIIVVVFALPEMSGISNLLSYTEVVLKSAGLDHIKPEQCVIYINVISILSLLLIFYLIDKIGRKISLIISSIGTTVALIALGLHFYLLKLGYDTSNFQWLPIASIVLFFISYNFGYMPVPSTLLSEMFPENMKSVAACLGTLAMSFFGFIATKSYDPIVNNFGESYAFWAHAALSIVGVPCALFLLTETKGKTFQQIQDKLNKA